MAWRLPGDKPLSEAMMARLPNHRLFVQSFVQTLIKENIRVTGLCEGKPPVTQRDSNAENVSIWWRHHVEDMAKWIDSVKSCRHRYSELVGIWWGYIVLQNHDLLQAACSSPHYLNFSPSWTETLSVLLVLGAKESSSDWWIPSLRPKNEGHWRLLLA